MKELSIILLCHAVRGDENRTQFNRTRFLCGRFSTHIAAMGPVSSKTTHDALSVSLLGWKPLKMLFPLWALFTVARLKKKSGASLLYSTYEPKTIITAYLAKKLFKLTWVVDLWDVPEKSYLIQKHFGSGIKSALKLWARGIELFMARRVLNRADKFILAVVPGVVGINYEIPPGKSLAITNGINLDLDFKPAVTREDGIFTLFYCGTVDQVRLEGIKYCMTTLIRKIRPLRLVVIGRDLHNGNNWLRKELKDLEDNLILEIKGMRPYREVIEFANKSDVCLSPYPDHLDIAQTYPVKIFDYMAAGKPVVASALPGVKRIITHGYDGLLFEPGDYRTMAEQILELHRSEELRDTLSKNAEVSVTEFSWDKIHEKIYDYIVGEAIDNTRRNNENRGRS